MAAAGIVAVVLFSADLGEAPLWDPDESKHAEIAREMLVTGRWIEPVVNFEPYHHKPSPFYLAVGLAYRAFGVGEAAARAVPALCAAATLVLVAAFTARRGLVEPALATALLSACAFFVLVGRFTNFDAPLTLAMTAVVLSLARLVEAPQRRAAAAAFFASTAVAVLIKGPVALVLAAVPAALALWRGDLELGDLRLRAGAALTAVIVGAWVVPAAIAAPDYVADFLWIHNVQRYLAPADALVFHPQPFWFFLPVLAATLLPWSPLVVPAITRAYGEGASDRVLADYALWVVAFFSMSSGKLATYVLPAYPALAILTARMVARDAEVDATAHRRLVGIVAGACAALLPTAYAALRAEAPGLERLTALAAPILASASFVLARGRRLPTVPALGVLCAGMIATVLLFVTTAAPRLAPYASDRDLAYAALAQGRPQRVIAYRVRPFSFLFYTGWPVQNRVPLDEVRRALFEPGSALVLTEDRWAWHLEEAAPGVELVEVARNARHVLYRTRSPWSERGAGT